MANPEYRSGEPGTPGSAAAEPGRRPSNVNDSSANGHPGPEMQAPAWGPSYQSLASADPDQGAVPSIPVATDPPVVPADVATAPAAGWVGRPAAPTQYPRASFATQRFPASEHAMASSTYERPHAAFSGTDPSDDPRPNSQLWAVALVVVLSLVVVGTVGTVWYLRSNKTQTNIVPQLPSVQPATSLPSTQAPNTIPSTEPHSEVAPPSANTDVPVTPVGEVATANGISYRVGGTSYADSIGGSLTPQPGDKYLIIDFEVTNQSASIFLFINDFKLIDAAGTIIEPDILASVLAPDGTRNPLSFATIDVGQSMSGILAYEVNPDTLAGGVLYGTGIRLAIAE